MVPSRGALLAAYAGGGDAAFAPGWTLASLPRNGGNDDTTRPIALSRGGHTAITRPGEWRQLIVSDGAWLTTGAQHEWVGGGTRPAETADYVAFAVSRRGSSSPR